MFSDVVTHAPMTVFRNAHRPADFWPHRMALWRWAAAHPLKIVFVLALLVRLINLALLKGNDAFFAEQDTIDYWALGVALANPDTFLPTLLSMTSRMPLYPLLLAIVQNTVGDIPRVVALIQAVIDAGTCTLIAALGALISPLVGLIAGILAALSVTLIVFSTQILTDTLFLFFFTLMLLCGARFLLRPTNGVALFAGLSGGLALATRPVVAVLLAGAVPLVFFIVIAKRRSFVRALAAAMLFALAAAAPIAPILLRNAVYYESFSVTSQAGGHLALWIVPLVTQRTNGTPYQTTAHRIEARYQQRLAERGLSAESNPFRRAAVETELAREEMAHLPSAAFAKAWLEGAVVNLGAPALLVDPRVRTLPKPSFYNTAGATLWEKARSYIFDDPGLYQVILVLGLIATLPFLVLEAIGFAMLARALPWGAVFAGGVLAYFLLVNGPIATPKYRLPMEPVLIVLTAIPLGRFVTRRSSPRGPRWITSMRKD
jgi:4-amino-4-deoxy-L-arabinose transferase-like glycosyltransferase